MTTRRLLFFLIIGLVISGCANLKLGAANLATAGAPVHRESNISYGGADQQRLDLYRPRDEKSGSRPPLVLFFHGGAWREGSKNQYRFVGTTLAELGFIGLVADYRKYPEVVFPTFVEDAALATSWALQHAEALGADPEKVILMGHSSGAHMAALVSTREKYLGAHGHSPADIAGFVGLSGPYAFTPTETRYSEVFGDLEDWSEMQADAQLSPEVPQMLLIYGEKDETVGPQNHLRLIAAVESAGGRAELALQPDLDHTGTLAQFAGPLATNSPMLGRIQEFVESLSCPRSEARYIR